MGSTIGTVKPAWRNAIFGAVLCGGSTFIVGLVTHSLATEVTALAVSVVSMVGGMLMGASI